MNTYQDPVLGTITIRVDARTKRYKVRITRGQIFGIMPANGETRILTYFIISKREEIKAILARTAKPKIFFDENSRKLSDALNLNIHRDDRRSFKVNLDGDTLHIACPLDTIFSDESVQNILKKIIEDALKLRGSQILLRRTKELADKFNFSFSEVIVTKTKSRWGSCSRKKEIRLTASLLLLPAHLCDYVILHELCHTIHFNHGEKFWELMDVVTDNRTSALRRELRLYTTGID
jgi:predicted metal-dependent hydrolase